MIDLTNQATTKLLELMATYPDYKYVRLGILGGGCSGFEYKLAFISEYKPEWNEYEFCNESGVVRVFVDPISEMYLDGVTVGYHEDLLESGFTFANPKAKTTCGCGKSFSA